jgi:hypothetical protein
MRAFCFSSLTTRPICGEPTLITATSVSGLKEDLVHGAAFPAAVQRPSPSDSGTFGRLDALKSLSRVESSLGDGLQSQCG